MKFGRHVVLSTAHVRCATAELLTGWSRLEPRDQPLAVACLPFGWLLSTHAGGTVPDARLPEELPAILSFGRDHGCAYVLLDCDGDRAQALPVFPW